MSAQRDVGAVKLLCTSGVDLLTQMPVTSECLKRLVPAFSLSMIRVDETCAPKEHYSEHFDEFSHRLFASSGHVFSARTDDPAAFRNLLENADPVGTLVETPPSYVAGATYQHLFKRNGIHHCLDVALRDASGPLGILGLFREEDARPFTAAEVAVVRRLYPFLVHALAAPRGAGAFDEHDGAMLVARDDGRVEWASPNARRWLEDATGGPERAALMDSERLPLACRELFRRLEDGVRPRRGRDEAAPTLTLPVAGGRLRLRAWALGSLTGPERRIGVQLSLELSRPLRVLRALEGLELPTQLRRVALRLWEGASAAQVASELGVSAASMKSYRKELYVRLEVHGADELRGLLDARARAVTLDLARHQPRPADLPPGG